METVVISKILAMLSLLLCSLIASFSPHKLARVLKRWDKRQRDKERAEREAKTLVIANGTQLPSSSTDAQNGEANTEKSVPKSERIMSMMICFSGGILLAVAMIHMLPEVRTDILHAMALGTLIETQWPVSEMVFCAGFMIVYFIEKLVRYLVRRRDDQELKTITSAIQPSVLPPEVDCRLKDVPAVSKGGEAKEDGQSSLVNELGHFFIIVALSFHSIFEGLAIGLQSDSESVWLLFAGVGTHKFLIAFCLGMELFSSEKRTIKTAAGYLLTFAVMSPIGIAIGIAVTEEIANDPGTQAAVVGVLQGLAGGTLLYVTFFELLNEQSEKVKSMPAVYSVLEWLTFASGFVIMTVIDCVASAADPTHFNKIRPSLLDQAAPSNATA